MKLKKKTNERRDFQQLECTIFYLNLAHRFISVKLQLFILILIHFRWNSYPPQLKVSYFTPLPPYIIYCYTKRDPKMLWDWQGESLKWWHFYKEIMSNSWPSSRIAYKSWPMGIKNQNWSFWPVRDPWNWLGSCDPMIMRSSCGQLHVSSKSCQFALAINRPSLMPEACR